jgi:hypothetical protein
MKINVERKGDERNDGEGMFTLYIGITKADSRIAKERV